ncbi:hypothetical protein NL676_028051 [Syzygium grande]|nr:hypothetical protein NL676_028051 [Syzygium grande]
MNRRNLLVFPPKPNEWHTAKWMKSLDLPLHLDSNSSSSSSSSDLSLNDEANAGACRAMLRCAASLSIRESMTGSCRWTMLAPENRSNRL